MDTICKIKKELQMNMIMFCGMNVFCLPWGASPHALIYILQFMLQLLNTPLKNVVAASALFIISCRIKQIMKQIL